MNKREIIERLKNLAGQAVYTVGEKPFVMSLDDGIAVHEAIELLEKSERKRGKWIELSNSNHNYICSLCGRMLVGVTDGKNMVAKNYPFCHCGADMRGEQE